LSQRLQFGTLAKKFHSYGSEKLAANRYVGIGKETIYGTAVAASRYVEAPDSFQPDPGVTILDPFAYRARQYQQLTKFRARGNIGGWKFLPECIIGEALYGVLGAKSSAQQGGTVAYKHTFTPADTLVSWTLRKGVELTELVYPGCLFNKLTINSKHGELVEAILEVLGVGAAPTKVALGTPTFSTLQPFSYHQATILLAGSDKSTMVYDLSVAIDNNIPIDKGGHGSKYFPKIRVGNRLVNGKLSTFFDETNQYDAFIAGTEFTLNNKWVGAQIGATAYYYTLELDLPRCVYNSKGAPEIKPLAEPLVVDAPFDALYSTVGAYNAEIKAYLTNTITAY
jgi:hypothetical protein